MTTYRGGKREAGFTLIEIIGVMAILAIMAGMLAPNLIKQIENAQEDAEEGNLERLAGGLEAYVLAERLIPASSGAGGFGDWAFYIFQQTNIPVAQIRANNNGCTRRYWFDPGTGLATDLLNPYDQDTTAGNAIPTAPPTNARAMLISDLSKDCSEVIDAAGGFPDTWTQTGGSALLESATLKIQRINFRQLFEPVALLNRPSTQSVRRSFSATDAAAAVAVPNPARVPAFDLPNVTVTGILINGLAVATSDNGAGGPLNLTNIRLTVDVDGNGNTLADNFFTGNLMNAILPTDNCANCPYTLGGADQIFITLDNFTAAAGGVTPSRTDVYIDLTVTYTAPANWQVIGQADNTDNSGAAVVAVDSTDVIPNAAAVTIYLINGTQLFLCSGAGGVGVDCQGGAVPQLASLFIKESDSFVFSPGPPAIWGR